MKIEQISMISFGEVHGLTLSLPLQMPLTECGIDAETLSAFLGFIFYGNAEPYPSHSAPALEGFLVFISEDNVRYQISRKAVPDEDGAPDSSYVTVENLTSGTPCTLDTTPGEAFFGVSEDVFLALILSPDMIASPLPPQLQNELDSLLQSNKDSLRQARILERIDEARNSLLLPSGTGGAIYELERQAEDIKRQINASNQVKTRIASIEDSLSHIEQECAEAEDSLKKLQELDTAYQNLSRVRAYDSLHRLEDDLDVIKEEYAAFCQAHTINGFLPDEAYREEIARGRLSVSESARQFHSAQKALKLIEEEQSFDKRIEQYANNAEKYGGITDVRKTANTLSRRIAHTTLFTILAVFLAAFFSVGGLLAQKVNIELALVLFSLALTAFFSAIVLLCNRHQTANALLILCRDYGAKYKSELFAKLQLLESETERKSLYESKVQIARSQLEKRSRSFMNALAALNATAQKWGRTIDTLKTAEQLDLLDEDLYEFFDKNRTFLLRLHECENKVALARRNLSGYSEITVRALVSPSKRENLACLEREGRIDEITSGIAFYREKLEELNARKTDLQENRAELSARINSPSELTSRLHELYSRISSTRALYRSYRIAKELFMLIDSDSATNVRSLYTNYTDALRDKLQSAPIPCDAECALALRLTLTDLLFREQPPFLCASPLFSDGDTAFLDAIREKAGKKSRQVILLPHQNQKENAS